MRRLLVGLGATVALVLVSPTASAQAACSQRPTYNTTVWLSTVENAAVNRILTRNEVFGAQDGVTRGMQAISIDPCQISTEETRGYINSLSSPCFRYRTDVRKGAGHYYGSQTVWRVSCGTGAIISRVVDRTWDRYVGSN